jgi:hypothetical protein
MKRTLKVVGVLFLVVAVLIQFVRPERTNPPEQAGNFLGASVSVPSSVQDILQRSCMDCHSNRTRWPWYSNIAPVSWLVARDVHNGRAKMNLSEWGTYKPKRMIVRLDMMVSEVDKGDMPPRQYLLIHRDAELTEDQKTLLCDWAEHLSDTLKEVNE